MDVTLRRLVFCLGLVPSATCVNLGVPPALAPDDAGQRLLDGATNRAGFDTSRPPGDGESGLDAGGGVPDTAPTADAVGAAVGVKCTVATQCASGYCVDGVCCKTPCTGKCVACNLAGNMGICASIPAGQDPANDCTPQMASTCGTDGSCDGKAACRMHPTSTVCAPSTCTGSTYTPARTCNGTGTCMPAKAASCGSYKCGVGGVCLMKCADTNDCVGAYYCDKGSCSGPKPLGSPCGAGSECDSTFCQQGVCCASTCTDTCRSCALPGTPGTCTPAADGDDPLGQCSDAGRTSCGTDGACDGSGKCRLYGAGTTCAAATCSGSTFTDTGACDGSGGCSIPASSSCGKYQCNAAACGTSCGSTAQCTSPNVCNAGACGGLKGEYYDNDDLTNLVLTRIDPLVDFDWGGGTPDSSIGVDSFSIRWTGKVTPRYSETYTFYVRSDDGSRLWVDGALLVDSWVVQTPTETSGTISFSANQPYDIRLEYFQGNGGDSVTLSWSSSSLSKEVVPTSATSPP